MATKAKWLLLGSINGAPFSAEVGEGQNPHTAIAQQVVAGVHPNIYSMVALPLVGENVFLSFNKAENGTSIDCVLTFSLGQKVQISDLTEYLHFINFVKAQIAAQQKINIGYVYSISLL